MDVEAITATKNEILAELHKDVFLQPKGMIKFVQLFLVICTFALTTSSSGTTTLTLKIADPKAYDVSATVHTRYPFGKYDYSQTVKANSSLNGDVETKGLAFKDSFESESKFFVFVGVVSFLYVLGVIIAYGWYRKFQEMSAHFKEYFTKVDFCTTAVLTFLWFLAVTLWSAGFSAMRADIGLPTELPLLLQQIATDAGSSYTPTCVSPLYNCIMGDTWSKLYASIIFGYVCVFLFGANCWYCFKDTEWHAEPELLMGKLQIRTDGGEGAATSGYGDNNPATIQPGAI